jgi:WD40 repeat protein
MFSLHILFCLLKKGHSSEEDIDLCEKDEYEEEMAASEGVPSLRTPVCEFAGHTGVVMAADWLPGGDQVITASWDRTASLYDVETREMLQSLSGGCPLTECLNMFHIFMTNTSYYVQF